MVMCLHPVVQEAYSEVHSWLEKRDDTTGYMSNYRPNLKSMRMKDIANQFALYFPTHHFKCRYALENIISCNTFLGGLQQNTSIVLIDIGCGAGAASAALISIFLKLADKGRLPEQLQLACIGVDPAENVLGIYYQLLSQIQQQITSSPVNLEIRIIDKPVSESVTDLDEHLQILLRCWQQPALSHVFLVQSNVVSPLGSLYENRKCRRDRLNNLGIPPEVYIGDEEFGSREARSYLQLFRQIPIDNLYTLTVGTTDEKSINRVREMGKSIKNIFVNHKVCPLDTDDRKSLRFTNPDDSYWKETKGNKLVDTEFSIDVRSVKNSQFAGDTHWHRIINIDNLRLAWARVRLIRLREAISDEIEIRLFESDLDNTLQRLQRELILYSKNVAQTDDRLQYLFPKGEEAVRPYVLPRLEEDIVSVAIIQELGGVAFGLHNRSYAYRPHNSFPRPTEYLYQYWFEAYRRFKDDIRIGVGLEGTCNILKADVEKYYTNINQKRLLDSVVRELRTQSDRVKWLLERFLIAKLHPEHHCTNHGLAQGSAGSGFYANTFLVPLDSSFGTGDVRYYRYMDDIYFVVPKTQDLESVKTKMDEVLGDLGLKRNYKKTETYNSENYLELWDYDDELDYLSERYIYLTNCLWFLNPKYRHELKNNWWEFIKTYQKKLRSLNVYVEEDRLSRKLHQYLSNRKRRRDKSSNQVKELNYPPLDANEWTNCFKDMNVEWIHCRDNIRNKLICLLRASYNGISNAKTSEETQQAARRVRFCINRLTRLGFHNIEDLIIKTLRENPAVIRQPRVVFQSLGIQQYGKELQSLLDYYEASSIQVAPYYVALILEALRFLQEIPDCMTEKIISIAINNSQPPIVRLKATETLLTTNCREVAEHTEAIQHLLRNEPTPRLRKNYKLLLGQCDQTIDCDSESTDYLLQSVCKVIQLGQIEKLFDCVEPDIIRKNYYGWEYPDDSREFGEFTYY